MNNGKTTGWYSWPVIIAMFIFFWPVGLFLFIKRLSADKTAAVSASSGKGMKVGGIVLLVLGIFGFIGCVSDPDSASGVVVFLFFIVGGILLLRKAKKLKQEGESIKQYLSIIVNGGARQLDSIAATTGKSYDVVHKEVKNMIDKGFLKNAYIDEGLREVVLPNSAPAPQYTANTATANTAPAQQQQTKIVTCRCCGANNTILGAVGECEYCGTPLK